ncbi:copper chaperone CopZ [Anoxybacillus tengchongensis]|uniref:Copper chaperone CopZ n=1 Tax=Anoxybacillus tengchongensis TaxID=576944 RepID=A0A7W9YNX7_9BACL|nr:copper chaperone CopZ [Anoxybacillus tengchongensis]
MNVGGTTHTFVSPRQRCVCLFAKRSETKDTVNVDYDETKVSVEKLKEVIEEQGYDVK